METPIKATLYDMVISYQTANKIVKFEKYEMKDYSTL